MIRHLVIFARAPQFGRVKRRLGQAIGTAEATRFYRATLRRQIAALSSDPRWKVWLFVTPDTERRHIAWCGAVLPDRVQPQGRGDLGQRMLRPFKKLPPGPVVLVGSDIPAMRPSHVAHAFRLLARHELVFGPANDGGFWLVGARRRRPMPRSLYANVRWSTAHALADTRANIPVSVSVGLADELDDVDTAEDLRRYRLSLPSSSRTCANTESQSPGRG
jgi:rSAM/selenodomain-associated transferase 1